MNFLISAHNLPQNLLLQPDFFCSCICNEIWKIFFYFLYLTPPIFLLLYPSPASLHPRGVTLPRRLSNYKLKYLFFISKHQMIVPSQGGSAHALLLIFVYFIYLPKIRWVSCQGVWPSLTVNKCNFILHHLLKWNLTSGTTSSLWPFQNCTSFFASTYMDGDWWWPSYLE